MSGRSPSKKTRDQRQDPDEDPPDPDSLIFNGLRRRFGRRWATLLFLGALGGAWLWKNAPPAVWETIVGVFTADPKAVAGEPTILLFKLDHDEEGHQRVFVRRALADIPATTLLHAYATITADIEAEGHEEARDWLDRTGAQIAVWGRAVETGGKAGVELFVTMPRSKLGATDKALLMESSGEFKLPAELGGQLYGLTRVAEVAIAGEMLWSGSNVHYLPEQIRPLMDEVASFFQPPQDLKISFNVKDLAGALVLAADILFAWGNETDSEFHLAKAVEFYRILIQGNATHLLAAGLPGVQNGLGLALMGLGRVRLDTQLIEEGVESLRGAAAGCSDKVAQAHVMHNLGVAQVSLGRKRSDAAIIEQGVDAIRQAMVHRTKVSGPIDWAGSQIQLSDGLVALGVLRSNQAELQAGIDGITAALDDELRRAAPLLWARAHEKRGSGYLALCQITNNAEHASRAATDLEDALSVFDRNRSVRVWAAAQVTLGNARLLEGELRGTPEPFTKAIDAYRAALAEPAFRQGCSADAVVAENGLERAMAALDTLRRKP